MSGADHRRDPCPWTILSDFGSAFAMGTIGGGIWHGVKGAKNSPRGGRLPGAISSIKVRAPVVGGNIGVWSGLISTFGCVFSGLRQKEDIWNSILSGFMTGGCLAARGGPAAIISGSIACGIALGILEGAGIVMSRIFNHAAHPHPHAPMRKSF